MYATVHGIGNSYVMQIQKPLLKYTTSSLCNNYVICILALATILKGGIGFFCSYAHSSRTVAKQNKIIQSSKVEKFYNSFHEAIPSRTLPQFEHIQC